MKAIYEGAFEVLAKLGPDMRTSEVGMYYPKRLHEYYMGRSSRQDENGSAIPLKIGLYGPTMSYL
jgi:hypothetical protein